MRLRPIFWFALSLLFFMGAAWFWQKGQERARQSRPAPAAPPATGATAQPRPSAAVDVTDPSATASNAQPLLTQGATAQSLAANAAPSAPAVDPLHPHRLSNTPLPLAELMRRDEALLLANALVDTRRPVALGIPPHLRAQGDPGRYIVQARGPVTESFRARLRAADASIVSYIPHNAFLVQVSGDGAARLETMPETQAVVAWEPYFKLSEDLLPLAVGQQPLKTGSALSLLLFPGAEAGARAALEALGARVFAEDRTAFGTVFKVRPAEDTLVALAQLDEVQALEPFYVRRPANDIGRAQLQVATNTIVADNYLGLTGAGVLVGLNDTGAEEAHPDLNGRVIGVTTDFDGHGTHVAGSIASTGANGPPGEDVPGSATNANFRGMAPAAELFVQPISLTTGPLSSDSALQERAAQTNAYISNNSWTYGGARSYTLAAASWDEAVRDALPGQEGSQPLVVVVATGNGGNGLNNGQGGTAGRIEAPATAKNVITVGAIESFRNITNEVFRAMETNMPFLGRTDSSNEVVSFSARGNVGVGVEGDFGRFKPDVVAPGSFVVSTRSSEWSIPSNSTSRIVNTIDNQALERNETNSYTLFVPDDAVSLRVRVLTNQFTGDPLPTMFIHARNGFSTTPADYQGSNDVTFPVFSDIWTYSIGSTNTEQLRFDIQTIITITNDDGNFFQVLDTLNQPLGPYYRYESGTSMAAGMVSGLLALMQEHFEREFNLTPSPALMKALLINGARAVSDAYSFQTDPIQNIQGWGMPNLTNSLPLELDDGPLRFVDQSSTNGLITGQRHIRTVNVGTNISDFPLRISLVWTDPPGNPASGIKLVNDLDLIVSAVGSSDGGATMTTNAVFVGNNFSGARIFSEISQVDTNTGGLPTDVVNNVENVYIQPPLASQYIVEVAGRRINVNAVTDQTVGVMQDYALVVSTGTAGPNTGAPVTIAGPTEGFDPFPSLQDITNGLPLLDQRIGANSPLLTSTNGVTNQWNFYVLTNSFNPPTGATNVAGISNGGPYVAFTTFLPPNLSRSRFLAADIDLYVSTDPAITNLNEAAIAGALKSTRRGGTESVIITNSQDGDIWYAGVKSEDQQASTYGFFGIASDTPFSSTDEDGNVYTVGFPIGADIPDGSSFDPGAALIFAFVPEQITVRNVVVTNVMSHQLGTDLLGNLSHDDQFAVLYNNDLPLQDVGIEYVFDDSDSGFVDVSVPSAGPGSLRNFTGEEGTGVWQFTVIDSIPNHTGRVELFTMKLEPQEEQEEGLLVFENVTILANRFFYASIDVPADATKLEVCVSGNDAPVEVYIREGAFPSLTQFDTMATFSTQGGCVELTPRDSPPLTGGRYYVGVYNPNAAPVNVGRIIIRVERDLRPDELVRLRSKGSTPLLDDAVTNSTIFVNQRREVFDVKAGVRIEHDRPSDLVLHLISPSGTRLLLAENRGYLSMDGYGAGSLITNVPASVSSGDFMASSNWIDTPLNEGVVRISYDFLNVADQLQVYYDDAVIFDTGLISGSGTVDVEFGPGISTNIAIVVNPGGNDNETTLWDYTYTILSGRYLYANFTEDELFSPQLLKFSMPPFAPTNTMVLGFTNTVFASDFEPPTALRQYTFPDTADGWFVTNDFVEVLDNMTAVPPFMGDQFLKLDQGVIRREEPANRLASYRLNFARRTFDSCLIGAWFGEDNALDGASTNHGTLEGDAGFADGQVDRAFELDGDGDYVRIPASPSLDAGAANGFTVEGWISADDLSATNSIFWWDSNAVWLRLIDAGGGMHILEGRVFDQTGTMQRTLAFTTAALGLNEFHHVAVTWDAASGEAILHLDGVQVDQMGGTPFRPDTTGDLLLGAAADGTAQFFDGLLDEFNLYDCALSEAEIMQVFDNGVFETRQPPGTAEFLVTIDGTITNLLSTRDWHLASIPFLAQSNSVFIEIESTRETNYFDAFELLEITENNVYYLPEESISPFRGENAFGNWQLEIWDNRAGAAIDGASLLSWQLEVIFANTNIPTVRLTNGIPYTTTVGGSNAACFQVFVPFNAYHGSNFLTSVDGGELDLIFNQSTVPGGGPMAGDIPLLTNTVDGLSVISIPNTFQVNMAGDPTNFMANPTLQPGLRYYLCVRNSDPTETNEFTIWVDFDDIFTGVPDIVPLTNAVPYMNTSTSNSLKQYYSFEVSSNAYEVTFETRNANGDVDLYVGQGLAVPDVTDMVSTNRGRSVTGGNGPEFVAFTNTMLYSTLGALDSGMAGTWYLMVTNKSGGLDVDYEVVAREKVLDYVTLTNAVGYDDSTPVGGTDHYVYTVSTNALGVEFEILNPTGNADLYVRSDYAALLGNNGFFFNSVNAGAADEYFLVLPEFFPFRGIAGDWWVAVTNLDPALVNHTVRVTEITNVPYELVTLSNGIPYMNTVVPLGTNTYNFMVSSNAVQANFEILGPDVDLDLQLGLGAQLFGLTNVLCPLLGGAPAGQNEYYPLALTNTTCLLMTNTTYYVEVINADGAPGAYSMRATEYVPGSTNLIILTNRVAYSNIVSGGDAALSTPGTDYYQFTAPSDALQIAFELFNFTGNLDLFMSQGLPLPTLTDFDDAGQSTVPAMSETLTYGDTSAALPGSAGIYYLGVINQFATSDTYDVRASILTDSDIVTLTNGVAFSNRVEAVSAVPFSGKQYYRFNVSGDGIQAMFDTYGAGGDIDLYLSQGLPLPTDTVFAAGSATIGVGDESIILATNGLPVALAPGDWYLLVQNNAAGPVEYFVEAIEVAQAEIVTLTNGVPYVTGLPAAGVAGSNGIDYYRYTASGGSIQLTFETFGADGDVDMYLSLETPLPYSRNSFLRRATPGSGEESVILINGGAILPAGNWHMAVVHRGGPGATVNYNAQVTEINAADVMVLTNGVGVTNTIQPPGGTNIGFQYFTFDVAPNAVQANFEILAPSGDVDLFVREGLPFPGQIIYDYASQNPGAAPELVQVATNSAPAPLIPGLWTVAVATREAVPVDYVLLLTEIYDTNIVILSSGQGGGQGGGGSSVASLTGAAAPSVGVNQTDYYGFEVSSNALQVDFQTLNADGNVDLYLSHGLPLPHPLNHAAASTNDGDADESIFLHGGSSPALAPGFWYLAVVNRDSAPVNYEVCVREFNPEVDIVTLENGVPVMQSFTPTFCGARGVIDYYRFNAGAAARRLQLEVRGADAEVQLVVSRGLPLPDLDTFDYAATQTLPQDDIVVVLGDSVPEPLSAGDWYLGVVSLGGGPANYEVLAREFDVAGTNISVVDFEFQNGQLCLTWTNVLPGVRYYVQGTETLTPVLWTPISEVLTAETDSLTHCVSLNSPYKFFRLAEGQLAAPAAPRLAGISATGDGFLIEWTAAANLNFRVEWNPDLDPNNWTGFSNVVTSGDMQYQFLDDGTQTGGAGSARFYRVRETP